MSAINLSSPEYLASLRKGAEHMRDHNLVLQDVRGEVTLALLDALHEARTAYLKVHGHDLQIACNEREALRARVQELEEHNRRVMARNTELKERLKAFSPEETFKSVAGGWGGE
jgi:predicted DCC family thiol-disulfide oxidoreductase YuxK